MTDNLSNLPLTVFNPADYPRTYVATINGRMRTLIILIGLSILIADAIVKDKGWSAFTAAHLSNSNLDIWAIALLLIAVSGNLSWFRPRIFLTAEYFNVFSLFSQRSIRRDQIESWEMRNNKGRQTLYIYSRVPEVDDLSIKLLFTPDIEFYTWFSTLENLDKGDIKKDWQQITRGVDIKNARSIRTGTPIDSRKLIVRSLNFFIPVVIVFFTFIILFFAALFLHFLLWSHLNLSSSHDVEVQDVSPSEINSINAKKGLDVTVNFSGIINAVDGPKANLFHIGEHIEGSYLLHTNVSDAARGKFNEGRYNNALATAQFTVKENGLTFKHAWGPGVFGDVSVSKTDDADDVIIYAWTRTDGSLLDGEAPCCMEINFDAFNSRRRNYEMLADVSLPVQSLEYISAYIMLSTKAGWTKISIKPDRPKLDVVHTNGVTKWLFSPSHLNILCSAFGMCEPSLRIKPR
jgi:hypothetical protein